MWGLYYSVRECEACGVFEGIRRYFSLSEHSKTNRVRTFTGIKLESVRNDFRWVG